MERHSERGLFYLSTEVKMAFTTQNVTDAQTTAAAIAARGVKSMTIGDRRLDFADPVQQIIAARMIDEDKNGGIYDTEFSPKGYFQ